MSPEDAQFIQTMKWGHTQIATLYKIPASRLNGDSGSSMRYANVAQDDLYMDKQACLPLRRQIEAALNRDLDMFGARSAWVPKFNPAVALQADLETRTRVADTRLRNGSLSVNEYRTFEDEPTIGVQGDTYAASAPVGGSGDGSASG
jgi:phage portal protein BeeE